MGTKGVYNSYRLSWAEAQEIRELHKTGRTQRELAIQYKVSVAAIWMIVKGRVYKRPPKTLEERALAKKAKLLRRLAKEHNTTVEVIASLGTVCHICGCGWTGRWGTMHIDHAHETNQIRGKLCIDCNLGIGCFKDSPELLDRAKAYLQKSEKIV
jgi:hypothetical protein